MANRYWIEGTSGNWNDTANWSTSSGGSGGASVPGSSDTAIFNSSGTGNCTLDRNESPLGVSMVSGYTGTLDTDTYNLTVGTGGFVSDGGGILFGSGTHAISGDFDVKDSTSCDYETSTIDIAGTTTNVYFDCDSGTTTSMYNLTVSGTCTIANAAFRRPLISNTLNITGTLTNNAQLGTRRIEMESGANLTVQTGGTLAGTGDIQWDNLATSSGITTMDGTISISAITFDMILGDPDITPADYGSAEFYLVTENSSAAAAWTPDSGTYTFSDLFIGGQDGNQGRADVEVDCSVNNPTINVTGDLTLVEGDTAGGAVITNGSGDWNIGGDVIITAGTGENTWTKGTGTLTFNGSGAQSIDLSGFTVEDIDVDKSAGTASFTGSAWTCDSFLLTSGTVDFDA